MIVDNACMQLASKPQQFDVVVAGNLYGDLAQRPRRRADRRHRATAAVNHGDGVCVYEAIHGGLREVIGADRANPLPLLMPALEMLNDLACRDAADRIRFAVEKTLQSRAWFTPDLGGVATTTAMTDAIITNLPK